MVEIKNYLRKVKRVFVPLKAPNRLLLNEAVHFDKQAIFIAIPKTGTSSVRKQMKQEGAPLIPNAHLNIVQIRDSLYVYFLREALGQNVNFPTESILTDAEVHARAQDCFQKFFKFSAVRNPWARAVSLYYRREGVKVTKTNISFHDFCRNHFYASDTCFHPTLHKNQFDWLCDENGKCLMDYVYKLENFSEAVKEISDRTNGRVQLATKWENNNPTSLSTKYRERYNDETKALIAKHFEKDVDYFKFSF